jgi:hypothetical protein
VSHMDLPLRDSKFESLILTLKLLEELNIDHWICNGTLLGLERDGILIPWDGDIDVGLYTSANRNLVIEFFIDHGFNLLDDGSDTDYLTFEFLGIKVDLNFFRSRDAELVTLWRVPKDSKVITAVMMLLNTLHIPIPKYRRFWVLEGYAVPAAAIFPLTTNTFLGTTMPVPFDVGAVLAYTYGDDWRVPKKDYNWRQDGEHNAHG